MKKIIASLIFVGAASTLLAQNVSSATQTNLVTAQKPLVTRVSIGENMAVIEKQLLAITNAAGLQIMGNLNPTNINTINFRFLKTNGVPSRVLVVVY